MSIRDRGKMKWQGFMMPEQLARDAERQAKPVLDEYQIAEYEARLHFAMEYNLPVKYDGFTEEILGRVHYLDAVRKEVRLKTEDGGVARVAWANVIGVEVRE